MLNEEHKTELKMGKADEKGCFLTQTSGFILLLSVTVLTVGVGLIVHFTTTKSETTHCNCIYPASTSELEKQTKDSQIQFCNSLGKKEKTCKYIVYTFSRGFYIGVLLTSCMQQVFFKIRLNL